MVDSNYRLFGHDYPVLHCEGTLKDLGAVMTRLNALEALAGVTASTWRERYGAPAAAGIWHLAVDHDVLGKTHLPEAIDHARSALSAPAWPWTVFRPGGTNPASDRGVLELLEAIGRVETVTPEAKQASFSAGVTTLTFSTIGAPTDNQIGTNFQASDQASSNSRALTQTVGFPPTVDTDTGDTDPLEDCDAVFGSIVALNLVVASLSDLETAGGATLVAKAPDASAQNATDASPAPQYREEYHISGEAYFPLNTWSNEGEDTGYQSLGNPDKDTIWDTRSLSDYPSDFSEAAAAEVSDDGPVLFLWSSVDYANFIATNLPAQTLDENWDDAWNDIVGSSYDSFIEIGGAYSQDFVASGSIAALRKLNGIKNWIRFDSFFLPEDWPLDEFTNAGV